MGNPFSASGTGVVAYIATDGRCVALVNDGTEVTAAGVASATGSITAATWHHVAFTFDRDGNGQAYIDGVASGSASSLAAVNGSVANGAFNLLRYGTNANYATSRQFDHRAYDRVLTPAEIYQLYTLAADALPDAAADLLWHYKLDDAHTSRALDASGNERHGTKTNWTTANEYSAADVPFSWQDSKGFAIHTNRCTTSETLDGVDWSLRNGATRNGNEITLVNTNSGIRWASPTTVTPVAGAYTIEFDMWGDAFTMRAELVDNGDGSDSVYSDIPVPPQRQRFTLTADYRKSATYSGSLGFYLNRNSTVPAGAKVFLDRVHIYESRDTVNGYVKTGAFPLVSTLVPRCEADKSKAVAYDGSTQLDLQYSHACPYPAKAIDADAATLNGSSGRLVAAAAAVGFAKTQPFSIAGWIRPERAAGVAAEMIATNRIDTTAAGWKFRKSTDNTFGLYLSDGSTEFYAISAAGFVVTQNEWQHVAVTYDGSNTAAGIRVYRNGYAVPLTTSGSALAGTASNANGLTIGAAHGGGLNFDGSLAGFVFTSDVLTAAEVAAMAAGGDPAAVDNRLAIYPMAEGDAALCYDAFGSAHLTPTNCSLPDFRAVKQSVFQWNIAKGCSRAENLDKSSEIEGGWAAAGTEPPVASFGVHFGKNAKVVTWSTAITASGYAGSRAAQAASMTMTNGQPYVWRALVRANRNLVGAEAIGVYYTGAFAFGTVPLYPSHDLTSDWLEIIAPVVTATIGGTNFLVAYKLSAGALSSDFTLYIAEHQVLNATELDRTYYPTTGSAITRRIIPARIASSVDALGNTLTNPAGGHNLAEPAIDFKAGVNYPTKRWSRPRNLLTFSESFDNAAWSKSGTTVVPNALEAPDSTISADQIIESSGASTDHQIQNSYIFSRIFANTFSVYLKPNGRTLVKLFLSNVGVSHADFDLTTGIATAYGTSTASMESVGNGWWRCKVRNSPSVTGATAARIILITSKTAASSQQYAGDGLSGVYVWGAQLSESDGEYTPSDWSDDPPRAWRPPLEMLTNTAFIGAVAATPGTPPTGWSWWASTGTLGVSGSTLTFTTSSTRHAIYQSKQVYVRSWYVLEATVTVVSGTVAVQDVMGMFNLAAAASYYTVDGVGANASDTFTGTKTIRLYYTPASDGNAYPTVGAGVPGNRTQSVDIAAPSFKLFYENPFFARQVTRDGQLSRVDRMLRADRVLIDAEATEANQFTQPLAL